MIVERDKERLKRDNVDVDLRIEREQPLEGDLDTSLLQCDDLLWRLPRMQHDFHIRMVLLEGTQQPRNDVEHGRAIDADIEAANLAFASTLGALCGSCNHGSDRARVAEKFAGRIGQFDPAGCARE